MGGWAGGLLLTLTLHSCIHLIVADELFLNLRVEPCQDDFHSLRPAAADVEAWDSQSRWRQSRKVSAQMDATMFV